MEKGNAMKKWKQVLIFVSGTASLLSVPVAAAGVVDVETHPETAWTWLLLTYGILKLGTRLDVIMNSLGIHVGLQGGNPFDELLRTAMISQRFGGGAKGGGSNGNGASGVKIMARNSGILNGGIIGASMRHSEAANLKALTEDTSKMSVLKDGILNKGVDNGAQKAFRNGLNSGTNTNAFKNAERRVEQIIDGKAGKDAKMTGDCAQLTAERFANLGAGFNTIEKGSVNVSEGKITGRIVTSDNQVKNFALYDSSMYEMPVGTTYGDNADPTVTNRPFDPSKDTVKIGNKTMYKVIQPDPVEIKSKNGTITVPQKLTVPRQR